MDGTSSGISLVLKEGLVLSQKLFFWFGTGVVVVDVSGGSGREVSGLVGQFEVAWM